MALDALWAWQTWSNIFSRSEGKPFAAYYDYEDYDGVMVMVVMMLMKWHEGDSGVDDDDGMMLMVVMAVMGHDDGEDDDFDHGADSEFSAQGS